MECTRICFKHEHKYDEVNTPVTAHNAEAGTSVVVKLAMIPFPHNITNVQNDGKMESIVHTNHLMQRLKQCALLLSTNSTNVTYSRSHLNMKVN
jgi:hypothetical protein